MKHIRIHYPATSVQAKISDKEYEMLEKCLYSHVPNVKLPGEQEGTMTIANLRTFSYITVRAYDDEG